MKYTRLTQEQLEALHQEFATFLAAQSIDKAKWDAIKKEQPDLVAQHLDIFSDLVWEGVLTGTTYLEHYTSNYIFLYHCLEQEMQSIVMHTNEATIDFTTIEGLQWLKKNLFTEVVDIHLGKKKYDKERNAFLFSLLQQGAFLSEGNLYKEINAIINN